MQEEEREGEKEGKEIYRSPEKDESLSLFGMRTVTNMTRSITQLGDFKRLTTQLGDTTRLTEQRGDPTSTSSLEVWKEVTRYGSQRSRGPSMPHTEREGSRTGKNTTRET